MPTALQDIECWEKTGNSKIQQRLSVLLEDISIDPLKGIGKPERLKYDLSEYWSRRIDAIHRIVYTCVNNKVYVISCRYRYNKD
jgi:toxin YoeB